MPMRRPSRQSLASLVPQEDFLRSLNVLVGLDQVLENVCAKFREMLGASTVYVILLEPITDIYTGKRARGTAPELLSRFRFIKSDPLMKWLSVNRTTLDVDHQPAIVSFLSQREQRLLRETGVKLVVPLIVVNRLTGAFLFTAKADGTLYVHQELDALTMLAGQSALAIEHAVMFQFQEDKLRSLFHADKLATVGELAAGAAHEIRNPLTAIRSTIQFLARELPGEKQALAEGLIEEVDRIDRIIQGLLTFSRTSELHLARITLDDILSQTLQLLEPELHNHRIQVTRECRVDDSSTEGDAAQIKQVFLNILLNSIQAMPAGGTICASVSVEGHARNMLAVEFADTGPGIPAANVEKVFDPFYTTKANGTGLGLSISYGIIGRHGGAIAIRSITEGPATGTTVTIRLPRR